MNVPIGAPILILLIFTISCATAQDCGTLVGSSGAVYNLTGLTRPSSNPWYTSDIEGGALYVYYWNFCTNLNGFPPELVILPRPSPTVQVTASGSNALSIGYLEDYQLAEIAPDRIQLNYTNTFSACDNNPGIQRKTVININCNMSVPGDGVVLSIIEPSVCLYIITMQSKLICISAYIDCEPGYIFDFGAEECVACPAGTSTMNMRDQYQCTPCGAGSFSSEAGSANCTLCESGTSTTGLTGQVNCIDCDSGTYAGVGFPVCSPCSAGYYAPEPRRPYCDPCSEGSSTNNNTGQPSCSLCAEGSFASLPATVACSPCAAGYFAQNTGQTTCDPCPTGHFSDSGKSMCTACRAGTSNANTGVAVCPPCQPGSFAANEGQFTCDPCGVGSATNQLGQIACVPCNPGTAVNNTGSLFCDNCVAGYYTEKFGAVVCTPCAQGYDTENQTGQSACTACRVGTFNPSAGANICTKCEKGTYQSLTGQVSCNSCPAGSIGETEGLNTCTVCLPNTYSGVKSSVCTLCPENTHSIAGSKVCSLDGRIVVVIVVGSAVGVAAIGIAGWIVYKKRKGYTAI